MGQEIDRNTFFQYISDGDKDIDHSDLMASKFVNDFFNPRKKVMNASRGALLSSTRTVLTMWYNHFRKIDPWKSQPRTYDWKNWIISVKKYGDEWCIIGIMFQLKYGDNNGKAWYEFLQSSIYEPAMDNGVLASILRETMALHESLPEPMKFTTIHYILRRDMSYSVNYKIVDDGDKKMPKYGYSTKDMRKEKR